MQISKVNQIVPRKLTKQGSGSNNRNINNTNTFTAQNIVENKKQQTSFKGAGLDSFCLGLANAVENGGLFVSFIITDMLGTNLPRPLAGLFRNSKENKGEKNKSFAAKELVREMLTGPSMFVIPGAMLAAGKPVLGKTIDVPTRQIKALGDIYKANPDIATKQEFFEKAFTTVFENANFKGDGAIAKAKEFATKLSDSNNTKEVLNELSEEFVSIAKANADEVVHTDFTVATLPDNAKASFKDITKAIMAYADDVLEKTKGKGADIIQQVTNKKVLTRVGTNAAMYAAVLAFLTIIPKLYNKAEGEGNSGLKGLVTEETTQNSTIKQKETANTQKMNNTSPSFGASSNVSKLVNTITTDKGIGNFFRGFEFESCNVSFPMLLGIMALGILIPRTIQAKDKYDREEILRRDLITCATMCFGEKILQKAFSKVNEAKSGFVLATKPEGLTQTTNIKDKLKLAWNYLRPIKGVKIMSTDQIVSKYSKIGDYKNGIAGFCDFINGQGGKLNKVFSLTDEAKQLVETALEGTIDSADNAKIKNALSNPKNSEVVKKLIALFEDKDNAWVKHARTINARFTAFSICILVPVFLGFLLPMINERSTKKRISAEKLKEVTQSNNTPFGQVPLMKDQKPAAIFKEFEI